MSSRTLSLCSYFSGPLRLWIACCLHLKVPLMRKRASVVWHLSLPLMNSFNKTESAISPMQSMFPYDYLFPTNHLLIDTNTVNLLQYLMKTISFTTLQVIESGILQLCVHIHQEIRFN